MSFNAASIYEKVNSDVREAGLDVQAEDILDVIDGYQGQGYGKPSKEDLGRYPKKASA